MLTLNTSLGDAMKFLESAYIRNAGVGSRGVAVILIFVL
jgi:hypothetical protein